MQILKVLGLFFSTLTLTLPRRIMKVRQIVEVRFFII